ncbi:hypothetical protein MLD38_012078 [Melastoma candidum]|uniref:Uncharacterized protein n=1 Tax=Melastoma candidum TaxID=119954 RepID=A0ACB9RDK0_9MYRT|nr:hypothetical protein MLD38_012078 [Melastoma candidum]
MTGSLSSFGGVRISALLATSAFCLFLVACLLSGPADRFSRDHPSRFRARFFFPRRRAYREVLESNRAEGGLRRIEGDLAEARSMILDAIRGRNYTSEREEGFVPRGSVYRNPYAFHQSHIEMMKRFKIWTYREGDRPLSHKGPMKHIYGIEGQFIDEIESPDSPFAARTPDEAHAFFIPISVAEIVQYVYMPIVTYDRKWIRSTFTDYVDVIADKHPYWRRSEGADHFMVSCHDWAPSISEKDPDKFKNFVRVLCNANMSEGFDPRRDVSLPEFNVPPTTLDIPSTGRPPDQRDILAFFAGGAHGDIRKPLLHHWKDRDPDVQVHEYLPPGSEDYMQLIGRTKFCLCPSGYEVASPRIVEAIHVGCVPVIISDGYALPFEDVLDWTEFSVRIPVDRITDIKTILEGISLEKYLSLQGGVTKVKRHFELNRPAKPFDALHMVLHSVWLRRLNVGLA